MVVAKRKKKCDIPHDEAESVSVGAPVCRAKAHNGKGLGGSTETEPPGKDDPKKSVE